MTTVLLVFLSLLGTSLAFKLPYVIGGEKVADASTWPWQGSLRSVFGSHNCGCSLISTTWAVTAAHCVGGSGYTIRFGSTDRTAGGTVVSVTKVIIHDDYQDGPGAYPNDIAVMQFNAIALNDNIKTIELASTEQSDNDNCYITGWGYTQKSGTPGRVLPQFLQQAVVDVYTNTECKVKWGSNINDGHVCIGDVANGIGACNGDSGGPLVCKVGSNYQLVGLASWVYSGCNVDYPSAYTRLSYFKSWVEDNAS